MTRHVHPLALTAHITFPDGHRMNATAFLGEPNYEAVIGRWRGVADTTEADALHARLTVAKQRYRAAYEWWMADTLGRPHPGSLADHMPGDDT